MWRYSGSHLLSPLATCRSFQKRTSHDHRRLLDALCSAKWQEIILRFPFGADLVGQHSGSLSMGSSGVCSLWLPHKITPWESCGLSIYPKPSQQLGALNSLLDADRSPHARNPCKPAWPHERKNTDSSLRFTRSSSFSQQGFREADETGSHPAQKSQIYLISLILAFSIQYF